MSDLTIEKINYLLDRIKETEEEYGEDFPWKWQRLDQSISEDGSKVYVPECTYLGETLIALMDTYENSGFDCLLIQEALQYLKPLLEEVKKLREILDKLDDILPCGLDELGLV